MRTVPQSRGAQSDLSRANLSRASVARFCFVAAMCAATALLGAATPHPAHGEEIVLATDSPKPLSPADARQRFQLPEGFRIEPVASEPLIADPVGMCFDARGRIFVCELHGYNLEGYLDASELNRQGIIDRKIHRVHASAELRRQAAQQSYGTVKLLEDTDGDGRMDRAVVWADRLPMCYGLVPARDGVIVVCAPHIVYLADRDGDGKPDVRENLFTGFAFDLLETRMNNPRWGIDNWIYVTSGSVSPETGPSGGTISGPHLGKEVVVGNACSRLRSDGSALEPAAGSSGGFGQTISEFGDRFLVTNQQHAYYVAPLPYRYLARNPFYAAPRTVVNISSYGRPARIYPTSQPHPWRTERSKQPEWVRFYGQAETTANGYMTAASGQEIYRATDFPPEYHGNHFTCDNSRNLIHRCLLVPRGTGFTARRAREKVEFLTSTDQWFRPVNLHTGPDGALYIVDMYREIIEDYSAVPRRLQQRYVEGLLAGNRRGRIWRVVADGAPEPPKLDLTKAPSSELVERLSHGNGWWRQTAQRLLVERGDLSVVGLLSALAAEGPTPQSRLHALYTLDGLGGLKLEVVRRALGDSHYAVRLHALRLAERWLDDTPAVNAQILEMVDDPQPKVRLQLALTLGQSKHDRAGRALATLAARDGGDPWMQAAILSSATDSAARPFGGAPSCPTDGMLAALLQPGRDTAEGKHLIGPLASIVGARHDSREIGKVLGAISKGPAGDRCELRIVCLEGLIEGLQRGKSRELTSAEGRIALRQLLVDSNTEVRRLAFRLVGLVKLQDAPEVKTVLADAGKLALDDRRTLKERLGAIALLSGASYDQLASTAGELLDARQPLDLQMEAIEALGSNDDARVSSVLLANWGSYTPKVQAAVIQAIFGRQNRLPGLLDAIEQEIVRPSSLDAIHRLHLIENPNAEIRRRAKSVLADRDLKNDRQAVLSRYRAALDQRRDPKHGEEVYQMQCAKCHRLGGEGYQVGPDLSAANNRADAALVSDVLDPSRQITAGYRNYTVVTEAGRIFTGVLAAETATSITLRREEKAEDTILRKDIDEIAASTLSMMPEDLEKEVSPQDVADLIAYLREALGPVAPSLVTLFEDDPEFAGWLDQGNGKVAITGEGCYSGKASLAVTGPTCYSPRIPGWKYPIAEHPGPGEFRYIRFAWRTRGGEGVMLEMSDNGRFPPNEKALRRYHGGRNTTGWMSVQVAGDAPVQWTVVTRDLWRDSGEFTLTGIAITAMGGTALFDRVELLRSLDEVELSP